MHTYVHCSPVYNSKDLEPTQMPINDRPKKMWNIYTMEYYAAIKNDEFVSFCRDPGESGSHHSQQTDTRIENQTLYVLTHRRVMNNENTWTQGGEHYTLGSIGENRGGTVWRGAGEG